VLNGLWAALSGLLAPNDAGLLNAATFGRKGLSSAVSLAALVLPNLGVPLAVPMVPNLGSADVLLPALPNLGSDDTGVSSVPSSSASADWPNDDGLLKEDTDGLKGLSDTEEPAWKIKQK
jgi:hypothetical protein